MPVKVPGPRHPSYARDPANKTTGLWCRARVRRAGVLAVAAGLALLTAACSGGRSSSGSTSSTGTNGASSAYAADKVGLARCLRAHGVPNYPDPNAAGQEPPYSKQLISTPQGQAAVRACETSIQMHGGIGFTFEHPLHRYYKRALELEGALGFGRELRAEIAAYLLRS